MPRASTDATSSTDRGCPLCQNTRPCGYMNPSLLEPPSEDIFDDKEKVNTEYTDNIFEPNYVSEGLQEEEPETPTEEITKNIFDECEDIDNGKEENNKIKCCSGQESCTAQEPNIISQDPHSFSSLLSSCIDDTRDNKSSHNINCDAPETKCCEGGKCKTEKPKRARSYQEGLWMERYQELVDFHEKFGHSCVPTRYAEKPGLGLWVKRQRNQYKLLKKNKMSTLKPERIKALEQVGFVWEVRDALWMERFGELRNYYLAFGDSDVPSKYPPNQALASWVKSQRHQQQLYSCGRLSTMTHERKNKLDALDFQWRIIGNNDSNTIE